MERTLFLTVVAALACLAFSSCEKSGDIDATDVTVNVVLPEGFDANAKYSGEVVLKDRNSSKTYTTMANGGTAVFSDVAYGVYDASAAQTLSNSNFKTVAPELAANLTSSVNLNGYVSQIEVTATVSEPSVLTLSWSVPSSLVIRKVYNFGTQTNAKKVYNIDKYVEIFNNSDEVQYADGLWIAQAYGSAVGAISTVYPDVETADVVYLERVVKLPGNGTEYPIEPSKSIVIAQNAKNHINPDVVTQTVDLSGADFECYVEGAPASMFPSDNASVPNIIEKYGATSSTAKFFAGQGTIITIFRMEDSEFESLGTKIGAGYDRLPQFAPYCKTLPVDKVIDAVDLYRKGFENRRGKHVPLSVDASYAACNQRCIAERKISYTTPDGRIVLQDTNNSSFDFALIEPVDDADGKVVTPANLAPRDYTKPEIQPSK